ncbi:MAG: relaxase domain-containing protein [Rhodospirillaceae bacterium]|nr:relaxase domain-containing protein [Rhodospirillaceae bacterium]MYH37282.1 relaxase domain-containing protein [Rhodospirillaceae bacterium]MYK14880.1 relaxase domain-containing protein [Rhodospirillaceae bacterium]MYK59848.1 relaxase domain-containing protein [Rhodospirillaceae bacterium]
MVVSIGAIASPAQGVAYFERDGYYAKDDAAHREASAWTGAGAKALGLSGPVEPDVFRAVLDGAVPDGSGKRLGRLDRDGNRIHRPGRDLTFSAPKSVSLAALVGGDERVVDAHDRAVGRALGWVERNVAETRVHDRALGRLVRTGGQKTVAACFRHDTSRNLDPQLHTHAVIANMVQGPDGKWRTMSNERLYASKMLIGALYRAELAQELGGLGYAIEKTHADGRFEIAGVSRTVVEAFSTRRQAIEAALAERGAGGPAADPRLAERAALMTRAAKRDVDRAGLGAVWERQAADLGFDARALVAEARSRAAGMDRESGQKQIPLTGGEKEPAGRDSNPAREAVEWAVAHLAEREAVFSRTDLLAAAIARQPGAVAIGDAERAVAGLERDGALHAADLPVPGESLTTDRALAEERETIALMERGQGAVRPVMRRWIATPLLHNGRLNTGQREAVKTILAARDRTVGVQGYAGTGKTVMLGRARTLAAKAGYRTMGLAPSASAARTLAREAGIESETLQRFLARHDGVAEGRLSRKGGRALRAAFRKTVLVVDEGSLASTRQARALLRIADALRIPRVVLVGDAKQLDAVDAGKPFAQLQQAGMATAVMDEILRQKDAELREAVEASLAGDVRRAFDRLGDRVAEVDPDNLAGAAAARWLRLSGPERENTGVMAPSHELRRQINGHIRARLARDGAIWGPAHQGERLVSQGYTNAEKTLAANYAPGDIVAFHRDYRSLGVEKGDERRVARVDAAVGTVFLDGPKGERVAWRPRMTGAKRGGVEVYRAEGIELRAGDRVRWTRNDIGLGLVNSGTAEVAAVRDGRVSFRLEDGRRLELGKSDPQLCHLDHAWAATVHGFQGRTVDRVIAVMEARHPHLTTLKSFYVEISRARHAAELVTDDAKALHEQLEAVTGERIAALEAVEPVLDRTAKEDGRDRSAVPEAKRMPGGPDAGRNAAKDTPEPPAREAEPEKVRERGFEMEL